MGLLDSLPGTYMPTTEGARVTVDFEHAAVHDGRFFSASLTASTATAQTLLFTTAAGQTPHLKCAVDSSVAGVWTFEEGVTYTSGGGAVTAYNLNRNLATAAAAGTVLSNPVVGTAGTVLVSRRVELLGGFTGSFRGRVLAASTTYLLRYTPNSSAKSVLAFYWEEGA